MSPKEKQAAAHAGSRARKCGEPECRLWNLIWQQEDIQKNGTGRY